MKIEKLKLGKIKPAQLKIFKSFIPKDYYPYLFGREPDDIPYVKITALGAFDEKDKPIGLIIGTFNIPIKVSNLIYIFVEEKYRRQKIGTQLVDQFLKSQRKLGAITALTHYQTKQPYTETFEHFLKAIDWATPKLHTIKMYFLSAEFKPPWMEYKPKMPPGMTLFPWTELTEAEHERLKYLANELSFPVFVSPLNKKFEKINSLGLRHNGEVVGWMFTTRNSFKERDDTINYAGFFVRPEYQFSGPSMKLLIESIKLHIESKVKYGLMEINLQNIDTRYYEFAKKRYLPYSIHVDEINMSWKNIIPLEKIFVDDQ